VCASALDVERSGFREGELQREESGAVHGETSSVARDGT